MLTQHIRTRCQQRGTKEAGLDLIVQYGTQIRRGVVLTRKDISDAKREIKHQIDCYRNKSLRRMPIGIFHRFPATDANLLAEARKSAILARAGRTPSSCFDSAKR